jgi:biotin synthesis protein BioG
MQTFFRNNNSDELILLFCGWGMDEKPFLPIKSDCDVLFVFDYSNLQFDSEFDFQKYKNITLLAFSAGVYAAGFLKDSLPKCDLKIAVNGTLSPFNDELGIAKEVLTEIENLTMDNIFEFRKKLVDNPDHLEIFNKNQPFRDLESSLNELESLKKYSEQGEVVFEYGKVFIGQADEIIPFDNQLRAWVRHKDISVVPSGHFLFYNYSEFLEIIN